MSNIDGSGSDSSPQNEIERLGRLIETYLPKLVKRCERKISDRYKSKFDQDDIVGTVLRTLCKRVTDGSIKIGHDDAEFWTLLTSIATRKISNKVRSENTNKRSIDRESIAFEDLHSVLSREPGPEEAASFVDMLEWLSNQISAEEMEILNHRFEGRTNREIADLFGVVERTISRKMRVIKEKLEGYL